MLDPIDPSAPNAVFPNNWFSTHEDGTVVLYPMCTPSRRRERDRQLDEVLETSGFKVRRMIDLTTLEADERYLEGTGSLVIDRLRGVAYAAMGPRTTERAVNYWCGALQCGPVPFLATMDGTLTGQPVYHTNVLMSIGEKFAVVCLEAIPYPVERDDVRDELTRGGKELIAITREQMMGYVANLLQVCNAKGESSILLSESAFKLLDPGQRIGAGASWPLGTGGHTDHRGGRRRQRAVHDRREFPAAEVRTSGSKRRLGNSDFDARH
ncbi:MAG: hypothetical protein IPG74_15560 [Flavobacteriales bacterium]|nr:hypothetical protein [Flavobacteriales bacterium]